MKKRREQLNMCERVNCCACKNGHHIESITLTRIAQMFNTQIITIIIKQQETSNLWSVLCIIKINRHQHINAIVCAFFAPLAARENNEAKMVMNYRTQCSINILWYCYLNMFFFLNWKIYYTGFFLPGLARERGSFEVL